MTRCRQSPNPYPGLAVTWHPRSTKSVCRIYEKNSYIHTVIYTYCTDGRKIYRTHVVGLESSYHTQIQINKIIIELQHMMIRTVVYSICHHDIFQCLQIEDRYHVEFLYLISLRTDNAVDTCLLLLCHVHYSQTIPTVQAI